MGRQPWIRNRARLGGAGLSVVGHLALLFALLFARAESPRRVEPEPMVVALVDLPRPVLKTPPAATAPPASAKPPPLRTIVRETPLLPRVETLPATSSPVPAPTTMIAARSGAGLSEAGLAGAATAEDGGGACNMAGRVQTALRKDPLVHAAVAGSAGKAMMVWDGDWVKSGGEDGKGLAAVREAIIWEVAFAPAACRAQPVRGLIVIALNAATGTARLAIGSSDWRWSDLLTPRGAGPRPQ